MDIPKTVDLLSGRGEYSSLYNPQVLEFTGGILALIEKAKTTLETMAAEAATESSLRSGSLLSPSLFSGASRADPAEHTDHRPYLRSSPKGTRILFPFITH